MPFFKLTVQDSIQYVCIHVYIRMYVCIHVQICIYIYTQIQTHIYTIYVYKIGRGDEP